MAELTERLLLELSKTENISSLDLAKILHTDHQVIVITLQSVQCFNLIV